MNIKLSTLYNSLPYQSGTCVRICRDMGISFNDRPVTSVSISQQGLIKIYAMTFVEGESPVTFWNHDPILEKVIRLP